MTSRAHHSSCVTVLYSSSAASCMRTEAAGRNMVIPQNSNLHDPNDTDSTPCSCCTCPVCTHIKPSCHCSAPAVGVRLLLRTLTLAVCATLAACATTPLAAAAAKAPATYGTTDISQDRTPSPPLPKTLRPIATTPSPPVSTHPHPPAIHAKPPLFPPTPTRLPFTCCCTALSQPLTRAPTLRASPSARMSTVLALARPEQTTSSTAHAAA
jgi:hypothetical protein